MNNSQIELVSDTRICIKCKHYRDGHKCASNSTTALNLVTGVYDEGGLQDCATNRQYVDKCGESGKLFESKK